MTIDPLLLRADLLPVVDLDLLVVRLPDGKVTPAALVLIHTSVWGVVLHCYDSTAVPYMSTHQYPL